MRSSFLIVIRVYLIETRGGVFILQLFQTIAYKGNNLAEKMDSIGLMKVLRTVSIQTEFFEEDSFFLIS